MADKPNPTAALVAVFRRRDKLKAAMAQNDAELRAALKAFSDQPGHRGGTATETGARFILVQAGLLPSPRLQDVA